MWVFITANLPEPRSPRNLVCMMQAYALTAFATDRLEQISLPMPTARSGQVLIRNRAAGVNNIDLLIRRGALPAAATPLPHVLGVEGAGVIEEVGAGVVDLKARDRVMWLGSLGAGGYAPYTAIDASYVAKIADSVGFETAAAASVAYATARHIILGYGAPAPGAWVLVHSAAGGVGLAALEVAQNAGYRTIALTTASKLAFACERGATVALDRTATDLIEQIESVTVGQGVALSLNSVAGRTLLQDLQVLGDFGQIISFGHLGGPPEGTATDLLMSQFNKSVAIRSSDLYTLWRARKQQFGAMLRQIAADLAKDAIRPFVHSVLPVHEAMRAQRELESGSAKGKIVLIHEQ
jgi:NADPH2:quinone reductase